jgi:malonate-semialdehyde dehydrogenase (acetylating)/methylmalonate-semialdehyde dehydrogenase
MEKLKNYINGQWAPSAASEWLPVINPATAEVLGEVPLSPAEEVDQAARVADKAFQDWRRVPVTRRVQYLFHLKLLLEKNIDDLARTITLECGKTLDESRGELQRAIENVEVACGAPSLLQGGVLEDVERGIDEMVVRQPVGVGAAVCPFNFPGMIAFWYLPYALACGNTFIVKPSERVPLTMQKIFSLLEQTGLPAGVVNLVNGSAATVDAVLDHPLIRSVSFVGSTRVARYVYAKAAAAGKRAQCQGGAKNPILVLPDADMELAASATANSAFACAGQRCLAASLAVTVGEARRLFTESIVHAAQKRVVGSGLERGVQMGPVITPASKQRIEQAIAAGLSAGAEARVDGRSPRIPGYEKGFFVRPTVLDNIPLDSPLLQTEIFGPVLGLLHVDTVEDAIALVNRGSYGNMACLFTRDGASARRFRQECQAGNIGINVGVAQPMAFFPFSGWKESFFGDLHGQSMDAIDFFTQKKVVIERWVK